MQNSSSPLRRLFVFAKADQSQWVKASIYSVLNKLFDIAPEILIGIAIDVVVSKETSFVARLGITNPWHQILVLGGLTLVIWGCESIFEYLHSITWRNLAQRIQHLLRNQTYRHLQKLDMAYFENKSTGDLVSILNDDVNQLERFLDGGINQVIQTAVAVVGVGGVFFVLSWQIAVVAFLPIPLIIIGGFYFQRRAAPLYKNMREKVGLLSGRLSNNISGMMTIKSFTNEASQAAIIESQSQDYVEANTRAIAVSSAFIPIIRMGVLAGFLATFLLGGWKVLHGQLGIGSYGVLVFLTQRLLWPLTSMAQTVDLYERAMASTHRLLDLLEITSVITSGDDKPSKLEGCFELKNISFQYATGKKVLQNISLQIQAKKTTAFVGPTGSGKSSLIKLLCRFYDIGSGSLMLDGKPIQDYDLHALRSRISVVSQDVFLFRGSVMDNIRFGRLDASDAEVVQAAKLAEADLFVQNLPDKYNSMIGERGQKLSGGQRQRLAIARAILKNPDVLILDEATSAVDNETEAAIQRSIAKISQNRTTIVIAHRLSTVVSADQVFVLADGVIKQQGTHASLLDQAGIYQHLWHVQTGISNQNV